MSAVKQSAADAAARVTTRTQANLRRFERDEEGEREGGRDFDDEGGGCGAMKGL